MTKRKKCGETREREIKDLRDGVKKLTHRVSIHLTVLSELSHCHCQHPQYR